MVLRGGRLYTVVGTDGFSYTTCGNWGGNASVWSRDPPAASVKIEGPITPCYRILRVQTADGPPVDDHPRHADKTTPCVNEDALQPVEPGAANPDAGAGAGSAQPENLKQ
jgi:hypothetical protein